jgi:hypothetical protein
MSAGDRLSRLLHPKRKLTSMQEEEDEDEEARAVSTRITRSRSATTGNFRTALYARVSPPPTASLRNETWDEVVTTSSVPKRAASYKLAKYVQNVCGQIRISNDSGSDRLQSLPMPRKTALKSSLFSDVTPRSKVAKHVQFTFKDYEISYEVTKDDIKNSWLDIDVSRAIEATENKSHDMIVSFGPTGRFTASDTMISPEQRRKPLSEWIRSIATITIGQQQLLFGGRYHSTTTALPADNYLIPALRIASSLADQICKRKRPVNRPRQAQIGWVVL